MEHLDESLKTRLKHELDNNPLVMGDLLKFMGAYTEQYNKALQEQRTTEATSAVYELLMCYKIPKNGIPGHRLSYFIDPIKALFPRGYDYPHSEISKKFLDEFVKAARREGWCPSDKFVDGIRNFKDILTLLYSQYDAAYEKLKPKD